MSTFYYAHFTYSVPVCDFTTGELLYKRTRKSSRKVVAHSIEEAIHRTRKRIVTKFGQGTEVTILGIQYLDHDTGEWKRLEIEPC